MMRSLYAGVSGLKNHQIRMDVIGNNIANVNTVGFKRNRVSFQDMLYQNVRGASEPTGNLGGTNPMQIGLGMSVASIDTIHTQGSNQTTGKMSDLMIQGDGFFALEDATGGIVYTRAGNFEFDSNGDLVNPGNGMFLLDTNGDHINVPTDAQSWKIDATGTVTYIDSTGAAGPSVQIRITKFPNPTGLEKIGENLYVETPNAANPTNPRIDGYAGDSTSGLGNTSIVPGALEMSNVDLSQEFTDMIITQRGFQANSRIITVSDEMLQELVNLKR